MRLASAFIVLVVALVLVAAGCGGGSDEASGDAETTVMTETTTDETTTEETTTEETATDETTTDETTTDTSGVSEVSAEKCLELIGIGAAIGKALAGTGGEADLDEASRLFDELAETVPDEIRADVETLAEFLSEYAAVYRSLDLEPGEVPTGRDVQKLQDAITSVGQPKLQAASEHLSAWAAANCRG